MPTFEFDIEDVLDEELSSESGGEVKLERVLIRSNAHLWCVEMPDGVMLVPQKGGKIDVVGSVSNDRSEGAESAFSRNFVKNLLMILFGFGFVVLIYHDANNGTLSFKEYMSIVAAFLGGLGVASFSK